jgi:hypothetical protein
VPGNDDTISHFRAIFGSIRGSRLAAKSRALVLGVAAVGLTCGVAVACYVAAESYVSVEPDEEAAQWAAISEVNRMNLTTVGKNAYFNLEPGYRLRYTNGSATRTMTVRRKTKLVDGVETRLVEEQEEKDGQRTRVVWKYYAIDKATSDLYCFGVHVQYYDNGKRISCRGWRSGVHGAVFTLAIPAAPEPGDRLVRGHAKRVYAVIDTDGEVVAPAGTFTNCLRIRAKETDEKGATEKLFAPGVGLVKDERFTLAKIVQTLPKHAVEANAD